MCVSAIRFLGDGKSPSQGPAQNFLDRYIRASLVNQGLKPSPSAPHDALIRRLSLDLTGLSPDERCYRFGNGLVRTLSNFVVLSEPPSHPELLEDLAKRFVAHG
ncbi:MAG: hypothetical protein M2R45_05173 [Verrucomicrobia subdivision 3 bacterium]|nr:hypothetical protein [Limisphaerales bacterium]MCS1416292.1 hypothetical protein [Limisphaerales bacterium]